MTESGKYINLKRAIFFVLGVIVTLTITKGWNIFFPEDPVVVKEITDSIAVVHSYKFENEDSIEIDLQRKLDNLKLLNDYEEEIDRRVKRIEEKSNNLASPNLLLINRVCKNEGWIPKKSSSFFDMACPKPTVTHFQFNPIFLNDNIIKEIKYFRLLIYRLNSENSRYIYYDEQYEVKDKRNLIQLVNDLEKGDYEVNFGFVLKRDCEKKYPEFYRKTCKIKITGANNG